MSSFRFLHAADLHLGSPFRGLALRNPDLAQRFAEATRNAFAALVTRAIEEKVAFVVIAGDVYDGEWKDNAIGLFFNRQVARLAREAIPVYLLRGNHDAESVVTKSVSLPESVFQFSTAKPATFRIAALQVALHGQGFADRLATDNLVLDYPPPVPGWFNLGVLHTALTGRPPHAGYAPCSVEDLRARGYDYWALGHVHEFELVAEDPPIVFPGNLQGRSVRETGPRGAVIVSVDNGRVSGIERLLVDQARWGHVSIDLTEAADFNAMLGLVEAGIRDIAAQAEGRLVMLRIALAGKNALRSYLLAHRASVADEVQAACHRVHADIWLEKLDLRLAEAADAPPPPDIGIDLAGLLAQVAGDADFTRRAEGLLAEIAARLPAGLGAGEAPLGEPLAALIAEARELVLQQAGGEA